VVKRRPEALLGDKIPLEDHIADDVVLTRGNGVLAMFSADGVFPDTADDTDIAAWFDRLHNALKNIAAEDVELTVYQCRGEADPSRYEAGLHRAPFARKLETASFAACCMRTVCSLRSRCMRRRQQRRALLGSWRTRAPTRGPGSTNERAGSMRFAICCKRSSACSVCAASATSGAGG
jgi:hypothetical protein